MSEDVDLTRLGELSSVAVPAWVQGVWQRTWVRTQAHESRDHFVVWIQTPTLFADLRSLSQQTPSTSALRDEGFAGWLEVQAQICRWKRPIDLYPSEDDTDQGAMFIDGDVMLETGILRNYQEEFCRLESAEQFFAASRGDVSVSDGGVVFPKQGTFEILVAVGTHVIHARRNSCSALRYGRYCAKSETVKFERCVGTQSVFETNNARWTVWSHQLINYDVLLESANNIV